MLKHILVPLDGSELAESSLRYAKQIVAPGGRVTLLSVVDVPEAQYYTLYEVPMVTQPESYEKLVHNVKDSARQYLNAIVDNLFYDQISADTITEMGDPASVIVDQAQKLSVDAVVMSTHGRTGLSRWLFGSVTQKVLEAMPCPVFVVPGAMKEKNDQPVTQFERSTT